MAQHQRRACIAAGAAAAALLYFYKRRQPPEGATLTKDVLDEEECKTLEALLLKRAIAARPAAARQ